MAHAEGGDKQKGAVEKVVLRFVFVGRGDDELGAAGDDAEACDVCEG